MQDMIQEAKNTLIKMGQRKQELLLDIAEGRTRGDSDLLRRVELIFQEEVDLLWLIRQMER